MHKNNFVSDFYKNSLYQMIYESWCLLIYFESLNRFSLIQQIKIASIKAIKDYGDWKYGSHHIESLHCSVSLSGRFTRGKKAAGIQ
jgi:hypothetical protein